LESSEKIKQELEDRLIAALQTQHHDQGEDDDE